MLKLLIFDLDGTLADTSRDITDAVNYALKPFGVKEYTVEETKAMVGSGISRLLASLVPPDAAARHTGDREKSESNAEIALSRFLRYYSEHLLDNTTVYPHVETTLARLGRYSKAVVSNKREAYSREILQGLGLLKYFDVVLGSDSVREKKPSPVPILELLKRFNADRDEALVTGDSNYDIEAARAAGVKVVAVTYGFRSRESLKDADFIIDRFDGLLDIVSGIDRA
ncbi:MAG: HAD-IA family hydrolase [Deferribacteres bacterium]|nr:HAD-IA family hydrolase [Deferribacteres bacterium]